MANAYQLYINRPVSYLTPADPDTLDPTWIAARIVSITDQNNVALEIKLSDGTRAALNGGADVPKYTRTAGETNVWRPY